MDTLLVSVNGRQMERIVDSYTDMLYHLGYGLKVIQIIAIGYLTLEE